MTGAVADRTLAAIEVVGLRKAYAERPVLRGISFRIAAGELFALLGPNGAGKTTTVEIIEGYRRPDRGDVRVLGIDPARAGRDHRARVGLMLQGGGGIDPRLTPREVIRLYARFHADPLGVDEVLGLVGLDGVAARTRFRRLSGGERQRVGLALALVGRPELAILDEPSAGMDVEGRGAMRELLASLRARGVTVLMTSHDLVDVERVVDRLAIVDRGRIVAIGAPHELTAAAFPVLRFRLAIPLTEPDRAALAERLGEAARDRVAVEHDGGSGRYRVDGVAPTPAIVAMLAAWCEARGALLVELRTGGASLEERYLEVIGAAGDEELDDALEGDEELDDAPEAGPAEGRRDRGRGARP
ncbi:MAG TPA: ABC transporter ATP-binding protein [Candidatus Limnocylindrales bacterium]